MKYAKANHPDCHVHVFYADGTHAAIVRTHNASGRIVNRLRSRKNGGGSERQCLNPLCVVPSGPEKEWVV